MGCNVSIIMVAPASWWERLFSFPGPGQTLEETLLTMPDLTPKQQLFVAEYLVDLNSTQAAIRAGYSVRSAAEIGHENLRKPHIQAAIEEAFAARIERTEITQDRVLLEYARIAFSNMRMFSTWGPDGVTWKPSGELSEAAAACIAEVSETVSDGGRTRRFKLHSKTAALQDVAKHLGMFPTAQGQGVNVNVNVNNPQPVARPLSELTNEELEFYERMLAPSPDGG